MLLVTHEVPAQSGTVLISEFATRGLSGNASGEFVELYNPTNNPVDISGWKLSYQSATGSTYSAMATVPAGTVMPSHTYYLLASATWGGTQTPDLKWTGSGIADNGNLKLTTGADAEVDRVGYGTGNNPKGSDAPNHGEIANDNSVERKASALSTAMSLWTGGNEESAGNGYNSGNNSQDFIAQTNGRNPQNSSSPAEPKTADGSGTAYITVARMKGGETAYLPIVFSPATGMTLTSFKIIVPEEFAWSQSAADVMLDALMTAAVTVSGDTIVFDSPVFTADSAIITLNNLTAPFQTSSFVFSVLTKGNGDYRQIQYPPVLIVLGGPVSIFDARLNDNTGVPVNLNQYVTVNGIVTESNQFGSPSYMQDATGGIAVYDFSFSDSVSIGDEVTITGKVTQYSGLTELTEVTIDKRVSTGNKVDPVEVSITDLLNDGLNGNEKYESMLVILRNVTVNTATWTVTGSGTNYKLSDGANQLDIRVDNNVDFAGQAAPGGAFDVAGIVSQYQKTSPYVGGYQLMPRMASDISSKGPRIVTMPYETDITPGSVTFTWTTGASASSYMLYGLTSAFELGTASGSTSGTSQTVTVSGLQPGTIYEGKAYSVAAGDTSWSPRIYFVTASATSTGAINVYFNKSVDNTLPIVKPAQGNVNLKNKLLDRIDSAKYTIDMCLYSLSGSTGDDIVTSLLAARQRGVRIRAIFEADNSNTQAIKTLKTVIPTILDTYDAVNAGTGLMHNKFFIIDGRDRTSDLDDWVMTGSWNTTDEGSDNDAQNAVWIQDQALAMVYQREFEEMWGSDTETPGSSSSRFGARKTNNTPHQLMINGTRVESYFSPSDMTTNEIIKAINAAKKSLYWCILTYTRDDMATAMVNRSKDGILVRGVMDSKSDQGSEFDYLKNNGIDVLLKGGLSGLLHHKYLIVDGDDNSASATPLVITGSHNWSNAAEYSNNENTIIIHDTPIAQQYLAEWYQRYKDAGGKAVLVLSTTDVPNPTSLQLSQNWPNPVVPGSSSAAITFSIDRSVRGTVRLTVYDMLGREVRTLATGQYDAGTYTVVFDASSLSAGTYMYRLNAGGSALTRMMVVEK
jgi:phosphatidylserine/phosphatidylglycerophosphate/cardiolipin synthase-like enzyme